MIPESLQYNRNIILYYIIFCIGRRADSFGRITRRGRVRGPVEFPAGDFIMVCVIFFDFFFLPISSSIGISYGTLLIVPTRAYTYGRRA